MKKLLLSIVAVSSMISCNTTKVASLKSEYLQGLYTRQGSSEKIELKPDGTYILYKLLHQYLSNAKLHQRENGRLYQTMYLS